jgi:hypothetical protein
MVRNSQQSTEPAIRTHGLTKRNSPPSVSGIMRMATPECAPSLGHGGNPAPHDAGSLIGP